ncbi:WD40 repeat domain-containing protein [Streptomyces sp. NPDC007983]|uniref:WD40 repeat domain-containing protein n=1 Tax=Streptomyces sp. NPDC007983 TaxID=3364800 RepID=UPI0036E61ADC
MIVARDAAGKAIVLERTDGKKPRRLPVGREVDATAVSPDGSLVAMVKAPLSFTPGAMPSTPSADPRGLPVRLYEVRTNKTRTLERPEKGDPFSDESQELPEFPGLEIPDLELPDIPGLTMPTTYARLAFSPDGSVLLGQTGLLGEGGRLVLWDTATGRIKKIMPGLPESVSTLWLDSGGKRLITLSEAAVKGSYLESTTSVKQWDLSGASPRGKELFAFKNSDKTADDDFVTRVDSPWKIDLLGPDGDPSAILSANGLLAVVGRGKGGPLHRLPGSTGTPANAPSAAEAKRWMAHLCGILGDETLPRAADEKLPPGTYRGALCPEKG